MRTIAINFALMAMCAPLVCLSQHIVPALTVEKTVGGCEYGATLSYQTKSQISMGVFYQTNLPIKTESTQAQRNFTGGLLNIPIAKSQNLNFYVQSRVGFVDQRFFVFVPGLETEMRLLSNVWIHAGAGLRMTYPSFMAKISFKF